MKSELDQSEAHQNERTEKIEGKKIKTWFLGHVVKERESEW
jgi:hypothetical protein